jgi:hypothetical protein
MPAVRAAGRRMKRDLDGTDHPQGSWFKIADSKERGAQSKNDGGSWFGIGSPGQTKTGQNPVNGTKIPWFDKALDKRRKEATKASKDGLGGYGGDFGWDDSLMRRGNSHSPARKAASAMIAKIPFDLASHIARCFKPSEARREPEQGAPAPV